MDNTTFNVYGFRFTVSGSFGSSIGGICEDFSYFTDSANGSEFSIQLIDSEPDYDRLPPVTASVYTPRNVVFKQDGVSYIDYQGRGLGIYDESNRVFQVISRDSDLAYEAAYLFLLSRVGSYLDNKGMHRVHALAISVAGKAVLVLLPSGGGKSTLAVELLKHAEVSLLSDDSPFVDRSGYIYAFPLRLGLLPGNLQDLKTEDYRTVERMEFSTKHLLNYTYFSKRVAPKATPGLVILGARTLAWEPRIVDIGRFKGFRAMVANCVIGMGLFQGLEFILSSTPWELLGKFGLVFSRSRNSLALLLRSKVCRLYLGRSAALNAELILEKVKSIS
ncbi:MAG: hypothetical protein QNK31_00735 [Porticoccus sp.]|nr:hypothetical protein [Porticoccus sp.]